MFVSVSMTCNGWPLESNACVLFSFCLCVFSLFIIGQGWSCQRGIPLISLSPKCIMLWTQLNYWLEGGHTHFCKVDIWCYSPGFLTKCLSFVVCKTQAYSCTLPWTNTLSVLDKVVLTVHINFYGPRPRPSPMQLSEEPPSQYQSHRAESLQTHMSVWTAVWSFLGLRLVTPWLNFSAAFFNARI